MNTATQQTETRYEWRIQNYIYNFGVEVIEQMSQEKFGIPASQLNERQCDLFYLALREKELAERTAQPCITCGRLTERFECIPCHEGMNHAEYAAYERRLAWKGWALKYQGTIYLLHFSQPYKHASHYVGFTTTLELRLASHTKGQDARLLQVITEAGLSFSLARTWQGTRKDERMIKNQKNTPRLCPMCRAHN